jgi:hypothetical protein
MSRHATAGSATVGGGAGVVGGAGLGAAQEVWAAGLLSTRGDELTDGMHDLAVQAAVVCLSHRGDLPVEVVGKPDIDGHALSLPCHAPSVATGTYSVAAGVYGVVELWLD